MKQRMMIAALLIGLLMLTGCNLITYENEQVYTLDATDLDTLVISHEEGDVTITGVDGIDEVTVKATLAAVGEEEEGAKSFSEERLSVELTSEGKTGLLTTKVTKEAQKEQGYIHLNIEVPSRLALDYKQNEGQLFVKGVKAGMKIHHGYNQLSLSDIEGDIELVDGTGVATLVNVMGHITLNKGSGEANVTNSTGDLTVTAGSGDVQISDHTGNITIRSGAGNINVSRVNGDVNVLEKNRGTIELTDITGTITQP
ncbi:hypothetical protein GN156_08375 [bacterium LRH843]|nr:hypothetical protein [bacterium LRH843]